MQSLMVRDNHYLGAAIGSLLIGVCQFYIYNVTGSFSILSLDWFVFIFAGPIAIVSAMKTHPIIMKKVFNREV
tara:strand:- start:10313 stop:10531 length:219 start_codon:yes stop_codon:yes gene_type:complete